MSLTFQLHNILEVLLFFTPKFEKRTAQLNDTHQKTWQDRIRYKYRSRHSGIWAAEKSF